MTTRPSLLLFLSISLLLSPALAGKKDDEAAALIEHAKQLSDIRAEGAQAFRLKVSFKIFKADGSAVEGQYSEIWVSNAQWRKETVLADFRRIQVASGRRSWLLQSVHPAVPEVDDIPSLSDTRNIEPEYWKAKKIEDRELKGLNVRCLETGTSALCFDKSTGLLTFEFQPSQSGDRTGQRICSYVDYRKFGEHLIPGSYYCADGKQLKIETKVVELVTEPAPDLTQFTPPEGAKESVNCLSPVRLPVAVRSEPPAPPRRATKGETVVLSLVIGTHGDPQDLTVLSAPNEGFDQAALSAVRHWKFKPATCDGEPIEETMNVVLNFRTYY
jgi:TonB family protein